MNVTLLSRFYYHSLLQLRKALFTVQAHHTRFSLVVILTRKGGGKFRRSLPFLCAICYTSRDHQSIALTVPSSNNIVNLQQENETWRFYCLPDRFCDDVSLSTAEKG